MKSLTKTHLMTLSKSDFFKYLDVQDHKKMMDLINFIKKINLFSKLANVTL